jgi:hypothetical protein
MIGIGIEIVAGALATVFVIGVVGGVLLVSALRVFGGRRWRGPRG